MTETRAWPAYLALAGLVGLLVAAYLANGDSASSAMTIRPDRANPGQTVHVQLDHARQVSTQNLTFERGDNLFWLSGGTWVSPESMSDGPFMLAWSFEPSSGFDVTLPLEVPSGSYRVCTEIMDEALMTLDEFTLDSIERLCAPLHVG